jgi:hypothetical protein
MGDEQKQPNTISGLPTDETPPGQLPEPQTTEPSPLPVPNPPGANPPHQSVTTPVQYPPYEKVSDDPPAGVAAPVPTAPPGQFVGHPDPPDATESVEGPGRVDQEREEQARQ